MRQISSGVRSLPTVGHESMTETSIAITEPKRFRLSQILAINAFGIAIGLPCGIAFGAGAVVLVAGTCSGTPLLTFVGLAALLVFAGSLFVMPTMWANPYVRHLVRKAGHSPNSEANAFLVQLALHPRLHDGCRGWLEDADDIGFLTISADGVTFTGDHVSLHVAPESIERLRVRNVGWRGLWFCGSRIELSVSDLNNVDTIEFCDRNALTALGCARNSKSMIHAIRNMAGDGSPNNDLQLTKSPAPCASHSEAEVERWPHHVP